MTRHRLLRWTAGLAATGLALAALVLWLNLRGEAPLAPDPSPSAVADAATLARGAYLARAGNCAGCHTARGGAPYAGGRGSLRMRARWRIEDLARGQWRIVVQELPHGVSAAQIAAEIESLTNPQPRQGRKDVTQEQKNLKQLLLSVLDAMRDESTDKEPVRLILEPKSKNQDVQEMMNILLANTSLETNVSLNFTMLGCDGRPQQKNLAQIVSEWVAFRYDTVERRSRHRLAEVERRIHILDGRMIAYLSIDKVIKVIRNSDEPKPDLMAKFGPVSYTHLTLPTKRIV